MLLLLNKKRAPMDFPTLNRHRRDSTRSGKKENRISRNPFSTKLRFEPLEDRRLLATFLETGSTLMLALASQRASGHRESRRFLHVFFGRYGNVGWGGQLRGRPAKMARPHCRLHPPDSPLSAAFRSSIAAPARRFVSRTAGQTPTRIIFPSSWTREERKV